MAPIVHCTHLWVVPSPSRHRAAIVGRLHITSSQHPQPPTFPFPLLLLQQASQSPSPRFCPPSPFSFLFPSSIEPVSITILIFLSLICSQTTISSRSPSPSCWSAQRQYPFTLISFLFCTSSRFFHTLITEIVGFTCSQTPFTPSIGFPITTQHLQQH